jgi:hypothetical protein
LLFEGCVGYEASVDGDQVAEVGDVADAQDDGALLEEGEVFAGEFFGEFEEFFVGFGVRGGVDEVEG